MTLVTVSIATYNREKFIGGAINSVLNQTYDDIEIIVVDDGSTDNTDQILESYSDHNNIKILINQQNKGQSFSKNRAAFNSSGKYIAFLDDDDRWHSNKIEKQVSKLESLGRNYCAIYTGAQKLRNGEVVSKRIPTQNGDIYPEILVRDFVVPFSSVMVRREFFEQVGGFDSDFHRAMDWDLFIRLAQNYKFGYLPDILVDRLVHGDNISQGYEHDVKARQLVWNKHKDKIQRYSKQSEFNHCWNRSKMMMYLEKNSRFNAARYAWGVAKREPTAKNLIRIPLVGLGSEAFNAAKSIRNKLFYKQYL